MINKLLFSIATVFLSLLVFLTLSSKKAEQRKVVMCHTAPPDDLRQFAFDPAFQALHESPLSFQYNGKGKMIDFKVADGQKANAYYIKAKKKSDKWLFVYQEWWGLNDYVKKQADVFYQDLGENVNLLAIDLYDGKLATNRQDAGKFMTETKVDRLENIIRGAVDFSGKKASIANVGWCFGGAWSLRSALLCGKQNVGTVMYYGMPVKDVDKLKGLNSDVLGLFATEDYISKKVIEEFAANMKKADKVLNYRIFDAAHAFANPSNPKYDEANAKEAYQLAITYLKGKF